MNERRMIKFFMDELEKREKIQEEKMRAIVKEEIKKAERRKEEEEMRKDPSAYHKRIKEIN